LHGTRLTPLYPYIEAECRYAVRHEYALNAVDFIARRTRLSFLNVQATVESLPRVIDIMGEELGWNATRKETEFDQAIYFLRSMGLPEVSPIIPTRLLYILIIREPTSNGVRLERTTAQRLFWVSSPTRLPCTLELSSHRMKSPPSEPSLSRWTLCVCQLGYL
jgi:hypothetical protein